MIRTNIMLTEAQHALLKEQSRVRKKTLGELVRDAIDTAFLQDTVDCRRRLALSAYQEGFISLGKLAETLGLDQLSARRYLREHHIALAVQDIADISADAMNA